MPLVAATLTLSLGATACGAGQSTDSRTSGPSAGAGSVSGAAPSSSPSTSRDGDRLLAAARAGDLDLAKRLAAEGADINAADAAGQNPYLVVTATGDVEFLQWLLAQGADPLVTDAQGGTGLIHAADAGNVAVVEILLQTAEKDRIDHVNSYGWTALLEAVLLGGGDDEHTQIVRLLLDAGADQTIADDEGVAALQHARERGYDRIVTLLQQADANP